MRAYISVDDRIKFQSMLSNDFFLNNVVAADADAILASLGIQIFSNYRESPLLSADQVDLLGLVCLTSVNQASGSILYSELSDDYMTQQFLKPDVSVETNDFPSVFQSLVALNILSQLDNVVTLNKTPPPTEASEINAHPPLLTAALIPAANNKRKRRKTTVISSSDEGSGESLKVVRTRHISEKRRENNRIAAKESRDRKKQAMQNLAKENEELKIQLAAVTAELNNYKNRVSLPKSQHASSNGSNTGKFGFFPQVGLNSEYQAETTSLPHETKSFKCE